MSDSVDEIGSDSFEGSILAANLSDFGGMGQDSSSELVGDASDSNNLIRKR